MPWASKRTPPICRASTTRSKRLSSWRPIGPAFCARPSRRFARAARFRFPASTADLLDKVPFGAAFGKGITMKMGQTNMHNYMKPLLERIEKGQIDPSYIISHRISLDQAPEMYKVWRDKKQRRHEDRDRSLGGKSSSDTCAHRIGFTRRERMLRTG